MGTHGGQNLERTRCSLVSYVQGPIEGCVCVCVCVYSHLLPCMRETMRQSGNPCKYMRYMYMGFVIHGKGQVISQGRGSSGGLCLVGGVCALAVVFPLGGV